VSRTATTAWEIDALQAALQPLAPGLRVEWVASTGSTNTDLLERMRMGDARPVLRVAEDQRSGRGRLGRNWVSAPGASLTFSLGLPYEPRQWSGLSLAIGAVLADAIEPRPQRLQLKWPNDLWLSDDGSDGPGDGDGEHGWRKLGGILVETLPLPAGGRGCVIGVGLNVRPLAGSAEFASGHACAQEIDPALDAPALLARVAPALLQALPRFAHEGFAAFLNAYAARDLLRGRVVRSVPSNLGEAAADGAIEGVADGVDADGSLRVRHGRELTLLSGGEVSVRPMWSGSRVV